MLLYDVTSDRSFLSVRQWIEAVDVSSQMELRIITVLPFLSFLLLFLFQDVAEKRIPIMLCANKVDLRLEACAAGRKCVSTDEGEKTARDHSAIFIETSAKDGKNVFDALVHLARSVTVAAIRPKCYVLFVYNVVELYEFGGCFCVLWLPAPFLAVWAEDAE